MEKMDENSDKPHRENLSRNFVNEVATVNDRTCENKQQIATGTRNLENVGSNYGTFFENAETKVKMLTSDVSSGHKTSDGMEVTTKLSSGGDLRVEHYSLVPNCLADKISHMDKFNDPRGLERHDERNRLAVSVTQNAGPSAFTDSLPTQNREKVVPLQTASESTDNKFDVERSHHSSRHSTNNKDSSHHQGLIENRFSGDTDNENRLRCTFSDAPLGNFLADNSTSKNLRKSCSHMHAKLPGGAGDRLVFDLEKSPSHSSDHFEDSKVGVGNQKEIAALCLKKEVGTDSEGGNLPEKPSGSADQGLEGEKVGNVPVTLDVNERPLKGNHTGDSDESDLVELDVKICDICGDAGREDLLAICCRCSDGAEHTYCMRVRIEEVPEGDWLCEECKLDEENRNASRQKYGTVGDEKDQSSGQVDTESTSTFIKPDRKGSTVEDRRTSKGHSLVKVTGKRPAEDIEFSSAFKKQALELPRTSSPTLVEDADCGKVKSSHQFSSGSLFDNDSPEAARPPATGSRLQSLRGAFFKSNSFSYPNARPKVKLVDEIVLQRQKSTKEPGSRDTIGVREIGKSMSFRSAVLGRFGPSDSKAKMLSPKSSHVQDLRGLKNKKERTFERTSSVKSPLVGNVTASSSTVFTPKTDKLLASCDEATPFSSACNSEIKPLKGDSKVVGGLKSTSRATNIGAEVPVSVGAVNKQLSSSSPGIGSSSSNGISVEQKPTALREDNSSKLASSKESTNIADGTKKSTNCHPGPGILSGTSSVPFQKYKQTGHSAQSCTTENLGSLGLTASSAVRSSKEVKKEDNKLKDAIEAALLKKPGIYRKNKVIDQADGSSVSNMNNKLAIPDHMPISGNPGNLTSVDVLSDWQGKTSGNSCADYGKQSNGNIFKQSIMLPAAGISPVIDDSSLLVSSDRKHSMIELTNENALALSSLSKIPAIPDHEYIWQGSFEISRSGKTAEFWDGLQAHLSTCASPRVFEAVHKLPHKILLNGVSRISAWPTQFENSGAKEDNIALYFFAKDVESYEKSYQVLLEDMIKGDLALTGSIDGVELLIFPSNQLPEKSHRWNMFFFLWGVLRGKKPKKNSLHQVPACPERNCIAPSVSTDKMSLAEEECEVRMETVDSSGSRGDVAVKYCRSAFDLSSQDVAMGEESKKQKICAEEEGKGEKRLFPTTQSFIPLIEVTESEERSRTPNLELALGGEDKSSSSYLVGNKRLPMKKEEEDDLSSSLSLSLSFSHASL